MQIGFDTLDVPLIHRPGQDCLLPEGFAFWYRGHQFRHRPGGHTDGMSSPQFTHLFDMAEPYGWALPAAVPHDGVYHDAIEQLTPSGWVPFDFGKEAGDVLFKELLDVLAGPDTEKQRLALVFYEAVRLAGQEAFNMGRREAALAV